eukprot:PhF_6_TR21007/c2_g1_i2/m.30175
MMMMSAWPSVEETPYACPDCVSCSGTHHHYTTEMTSLSSYPYVTSPNGSSLSSTYQSGFAFQVYNADQTHHFVLPSETVEVTAGSEKYCKIYASHGTYMKYRFQLCWERLQGTCPFGRRCSFIHCVDLSRAEMTDVHYNNNTSNTTTPRHPAGVSVQVFHPNSTCEHSVVDSGSILQTQGSFYALAHPGARRPQHCVHFMDHGMCTRGSYCNFIHVPKQPEVDCQQNRS